MELKTWLTTHTIKDLLNSKPNSAKIPVVAIHDAEPLSAVLGLFVERNVTSLVVYRFEPKATGPKTHQHVPEPDAILTVLDCLCYIFAKIDHTALATRSVDMGFLQTTVSELHQSIALEPIKRMQHLETLEQLLHTWVARQHLVHNNVSRWRVLVCDTTGGTLGIISPVDLIHMVYVNISHLHDYLWQSAGPLCDAAVRIFSPNKNLVRTEETAYIGLGKLLQEAHHNVVGIVTDTDTLVGHLSARDFVPRRDVRSMQLVIDSLEEKLPKFLRIAKGVVVGEDVDAYTVHGHYTLAQLLGKMLLLQVHQLWRVDGAGRPQGLVTIPDVIYFLHKDLV